MVNNTLPIVDGMVQPTSNGVLVLCVMANHPGQKMAARSVLGHKGDGVTRIDIIFGEKQEATPATKTSRPDRGPLNSWRPASARPLRSGASAF